MISFLGYNDKDFPLPDPMPEGMLIGRVVEEHRGHYFVMYEKGLIEAGVTGKIIHTSESKEAFPAVGDWVVMAISDKNQALIHDILPRKTVLRRRASGKIIAEQVIAVNIDIAFVVMSGDENFSLNRLERYLTIIYNGGIIPIIILNKTDLFTKAEVDIQVLEIKKRHLGVTVVWTSAMTEEGLNFVHKTLLPGKTYCFVGSSGVGKSSLINRLIGEQRQYVKEISAATAKGQHATTYRELIELDNGSLLIDTPGMREVGLVAADAGLEETFADIITLAQNCRFSDCTHSNEPGCAVIAACKAGNLQVEKLDNYLRLKRESDYFQMDTYERRQKDKTFAKMVKEFKRNKPKKT
ncbi:MAG: ribosome small subunit-dependent GTPase A [Candidatus Marinimicrobia bacterium]|nr:ribosome small subunit-dependent GTPase A [Candidatus Neomarinimicrobiota bacterium]